MLLALLTLVAILVSGCTSDDPKPDQGAELPAADVLLKEAAAETKKVNSAHFVLTVTGKLGGLDLRGAEGDLTTEGEQGGAAKGTATLGAGGQAVENQFVLIDGTFYIKGPTGGFVKVPSALASQIYNPAAILDPETGVANLLTKITGAKTEAAEDVDGTPAYRVTGKVTKDVAAALVPGLTSDVDVVLWLSQDAKQPVKAAITAPGADGQPVKVEVGLSAINEPVTVTAPQ